METLQAIYIALAVFGVGVTIVDLFGALDHGGQDGSHDSGGHQADGHDSGHGGGHDGHDGHGGHGHDGHGPAGHDAPVASGAGSLPVAPPPRYLSEESEGMRRSAGLARFVGVLRLAVYFSLGAGPTGLAALAMGLPALSGLLWAAGAGLTIAFLARLLRRFLRRDLDSSLGAADFILEEAEITVPIAPGLVGRALVRKYGTQSEVYVRATKGDSAYARGAKVRIIDFQDDVYLVEAADEEHLVR